MKEIIRSSVQLLKTISAVATTSRESYHGAKVSDSCSRRVYLSLSTRKQLIKIFKGTVHPKNDDIKSGEVS